MRWMDVVVGDVMMTDYCTYILISRADLSERERELRNVSFASSRPIFADVRWISMPDDGCASVFSDCLYDRDVEEYWTFFPSSEEGR